MRYVVVSKMNLLNSNNFNIYYKRELDMSLKL